MLIKSGSGTWHTLKQVEWYYKLFNEYNCIEVEIEHLMNYSFNYAYGNYRKESKTQYFRVDVWGKDKNGKEYIVEIGKVSKFKHNILKKTRISSINIIYIPKDYAPDINIFSPQDYSI